MMKQQAKNTQSSYIEDIKNANELIKEILIRKSDT